MKLIFSCLVVSLIFIGCGYKADPVYDDKTEQKVEQ